MFRAKGSVWLAVVFALLLQLVAPAFAAEPPPQDRPPAETITPTSYKLSTGDVISIRIYGEDDLTREKVRLTDSGLLSFPFGDVSALGLTVGELEKTIADGLRGRFLVNPRVSVTIEEYRQFFIYGQVEKPGGYPFQPGLSVRKAVSIAGGFKVRASLKKIFVVREGDSTNTPVKVDINTPVWPGDTVTVEESFF